MKSFYIDVEKNPKQEEYLNELNRLIGTQIEYRDCPVESIVELVQELRAQSHFIFLNYRLGEEFVKTQTSLPTLEKITQSCDFYIHQEKTWWCRSLLLEILSERIIKKQKFLDTQSGALITGNDSRTRVSLMTAIKMGYKKIYLISTETEIAQQMLIQFRSYSLGVEIVVLDPSELTLLPAVNSLVINCISNEQDNGIIKDLIYLNFLKKDGLVIDLNYDLYASELVDECLSTDTEQISGFEILTYVEKRFVEKLTSSKTHLDLDFFSLKKKIFFE